LSSIPGARLVPGTGCQACLRPGSRTPGKMQGLPAGINHLWQAHKGQYYEEYLILADENKKKKKVATSINVKAMCLEGMGSIPIQVARVFLGVSSLNLLVIDSINYTSWSGSCMLQIMFQNRL